MKSTLLMLAAFVIPMIGMGQMKKYEYTPKGSNKIEIRNLPGEISLQNSPGKSIVIESDFKMEVPDRAKGLKLLGAIEDNTDIGVSVSEENGIVSIQGAVKQVREYRYKISVPAGMAVNLDYNSPFAKGNPTIDSFKGSLEIHTLNANVKISNSTGPFAINTISGNVDVDFKSINQEAPTSVATVSGEIDITVSSGEKATFGISTINGNVYNNLDIKSQKAAEPDKHIEGMSVLRHQLGEFTMNGGGQKVILNSVNGNIYLRKH